MWKRVALRRSTGRAAIALPALLLMILGSALAQTVYQPKFKNDPAHSESEAAALGYVRTVVRAQHIYYKKYGKFAPSLGDLVHSGSFTKRMSHTDRGDYTVTFHPRKEGYELSLLPKQLDADHRSFYANEDGIIHADEQQAANESSPKLH